MSNGIVSAIHGYLDSAVIFLPFTHFYTPVTQKGEAYIYHCPYSSLCRQVVIDEEGRAMIFGFKDMNNPTVEMLVSKSI